MSAENETSSRGLTWSPYATAVPNTEIKMQSFLRQSSAAALELGSAEGFATYVPTQAKLPENPLARIRCMTVVLPLRPGGTPLVSASLGIHSRETTAMLNRACHELGVCIVSGRSSCQPSTVEKPAISAVDAPICWPYGTITGAVKNMPITSTLALPVQVLGANRRLRLGKTPC